MRLECRIFLATSRGITGELLEMGAEAGKRSVSSRSSASCTLHYDALQDPDIGPWM